MIALDTNVLVYAHRFHVPENDAAYAAIRRLAFGKDEWAIPWPCIHEFLAVVTNPAVVVRPTGVEGALRQVRAWIASPTCRLLSETPQHRTLLEAVIKTSRVRGGAIHDARIAAICIGHGVSELWSVDRDMSRFPGLRIVNPLVA